MKMKLGSLSLAFVLTLFLLSSCGVSKTTTVSKFKEITIPCSSEGRSNSDYFRASSVGKSRDLATSKEKALLLTKQRLASLISSTLKSVTERYVNDMQIGEETEFEQTFENMTRDIVKQKLQDIAITCEKTGQNDKGEYETYMALEVKKDVIYNGVDKGISKDKKLAAQYDRMKFKEKFDEEMNQLKDEQ